MSSAKDKSLQMDTRIVNAGRDRSLTNEFVNPPVIRASTVLFNSVDEMIGRKSARYSYGLMNTPTIEALARRLTGGTGPAPSGRSR